MDTPTLTTARLLLRPFRLEDVDALYAVLNEPGILRYFPNPAPPDRAGVARLIAHQLQHWQEHCLGWWAVEPRTMPGLIGWNGLQYLPETNEVEVGYLLSKDWRRQGLATEGARASLEYGFHTLGLPRIIGLVHPQNLASQRVMHKLGLALQNEAQYFGMAVYRYALDSQQWAGRDPA